MRTAECVVDPLANLDRALCRLAESRGGPDVIEAVRAYLASWSVERIAHIQRFDAGWAPFDEHQRPVPLFRPIDVHKACNALHEQCFALGNAGVSPLPDLLELARFLRLACARLEDLAPYFPDGRLQVGPPLRGDSDRAS
jgi:hypothetical protein